jgi:hypothetical protein
MLFIPEISIKTILEAILLFIRSDYNNATDKDKSYLAGLVKGLKLGKFDLFEQAVEIFINRGKNHPKELQVFHFFNAERSPVPTIHLILTDDAVGANGIGVDNGFNLPIYDSVSKTTKDVYQRSFDSRLNLVITSENTLEVITIYNIIRAVLIATFNDLQFVGFQNLKISGSDIQINPDLVPQAIFTKGLNLDFFYDIPAPTIFTNETFNDLVAKGIAISTELTEESSSSI